MKRKAIILFTLIIIILFVTSCTPKNNGFSKDDIIYFILTDRFYDGDISNNYDVDKTDLRKRHGGDLKGIKI